MLNITVKKSLNPIEKNEIKRSFLKLYDDISVPCEIALQHFLMLSELYSHPDRFYHNLVHINNLINITDLYIDNISKPLMFKVALWFHDAVYIAKNNDNELKSALLFKNMLADYLNESEISHVFDLIMSTEGHYPKSDHVDVCYFLDFDLSVLAADSRTYKLYSEAIWQEYKNAYPLILYKTGRKKVLKRFLLRDKLFFTDIFSSAYEEIARQNIKQELNT